MYRWSSCWLWRRRTELIQCRWCSLASQHYFFPPITQGSGTEKGTMKIQLNMYFKIRSLMEVLAVDSSCFENVLNEPIQLYCMFYLLSALPSTGYTVYTIIQSRAGHRHDYAKASTHPGKYNTANVLVWLSSMDRVSLQTNVVLRPTHS